MNRSMPGLLSITNSQGPPKPMSIESVMPSNHLILCRPLLLLSSVFPSIRVFSNESAHRIRWPKYWSFSFNISPSNEHSGLISFRMDWLDLLAVQGTLYISDQIRSVAQLFPTLCDPMNGSTPGLPLHHQLPESTQTHVHVLVMPSKQLILCRPLLLLPLIFPSIRVFSNKSALLIRWPKYWSFSFNISPSNEYSGLISFRMDWLDFLAIKGTLKSSPTP